MCKCKIKWIDDRGATTEDDNDAIGKVRCVFEPDSKAPVSEWFPICADHLRRMPLSGQWEFLNTTNKNVKG